MILSLLKSSQPYKVPIIDLNNIKNSKNFKNWDKIELKTNEIKN